MPMTQAKSVNRELWGVDGCAAGWLLARKTSPKAEITFSIYPDWAALMAQAKGQNPAIAVDMPIGLVDFGRRACDVLARRQLAGARATSIFAPPRRPMFAFDTYDQANAWGKAQGSAAGGGLSKQAWNLVPKIRQIDDWISPSKQLYVREAHPELAFQRLNHGACPPPKRSREGKAARLELLTHAGLLDRAAWPDLPKSSAKADDILDAAVLVLTAAAILNGTATCLTEAPQKDARGLAMEIWF